MAEATIPLYLGLGTNMGDRESNLRTALERLDEALGVRRSRLSDFIETEPWGFESSDKFLNAAVRYDITLPLKNFHTNKNDDTQARIDSGESFGSGASTAAAYEILGICKRIEREMGRKEEPEYDSEGHRIYKSRIIDIDILFFGDLHMDSSDLKIPHPLISSRPFVLEPLRQIAPELALG